MLSFCHILYCLRQRSAHKAETPSKSLDAHKQLVRRLALQGFNADKPLEAGNHPSLYWTPSGMKRPNPWSLMLWNMASCSSLSSGNASPHMTPKEKKRYIDEVRGITWLIYLGEISSLQMKNMPSIRVLVPWICLP